MRFVVLYNNRSDVRATVFEQILANHTKVNFAAQLVKTHLFQTKLFWPSTAEILNLPMNIQCEEIEIKDGKINSLKTSTIDVEAIKIHIPEAPAPPVSTPETPPAT